MRLLGKRWRRWATSPECERDFPAIRSVSLFQRVLLVQALRPDRLQSALHQFACEVLRVTSLSPPAQSLEQLYQQEASCECRLALPVPLSSLCSVLGRLQAKHLPTSKSSATLEKLRFGPMTSLSYPTPRVKCR